MHCSRLVFVTVLLTAHSVLSLTYEEIIAACKKENDFDGDVQKLDYNDSAFPKAAKCALACTLEKYEVFKEDGSICRKKEKEFVEKVVEEEDLKKKFLKAIDECDVKAKADKCETAFEFVKCKKTKAGV
ncbi:uncharacterized protein [Halyomorpha halys]|uniref:uncharacterized protein isoform X1 n=1 Tax=Halyomorpha halys TaxID=286706 RepID=UPI0006D4DCDC|nr:uncharacterized protein LOC106690772 isoform X1 [Halyomorpha halys]KAE8573033.1 Odorant-binding protein 48 isoform X1 [Halyomorpha halys]